MSSVSSPDRPRSFSLLIAAGAVLLPLFAVAGRHPVAHGLAILYVAAFLGAVAGQAAGSGGPDGKT